MAIMGCGKLKGGTPGKLRKSRVFILNDLEHLSTFLFIATKKRYEGNTSGFPKHNIRSSWLVPSVSCEAANLVQISRFFINFFKLPGQFAFIFGTLLDLPFAT